MGERADRIIDSAVMAAVNGGCRIWKFRSLDGIVKFVDSVGDEPSLQSPQAAIPTIETVIHGPWENEIPMSVEELQYLIWNQAENRVI